MIKSLLSKFTGANPKTPDGWNGRLPPYTIAYVIGDVHGYDDALSSIHDQIDDHRERQIDDHRKKQLIAEGEGNDPLPDLKIYEINLADFTDRGPHTKEVLDLQVQRHAQNKRARINTQYLLADHEYMFMSMLSDKETLDWLSKGFFDNGGLTTLESYGVIPRISANPKNESAHQIHGTDMFVHDEELLKMKADLWSGKLPLAHAELLQKAKLMLHLGSYTFVHAAVDPTRPIKTDLQDERVLVGITSKAREFATYNGPIPGDRIIVRGHTISEKPVLTHNQIGIDTGIYRGGKLTCAVLQGADVQFIQAESQLPPYNLSATAGRAAAASDQIGPISAWASLDERKPY